MMTSSRSVNPPTVASSALLLLLLAVVWILPAWAGSNISTTNKYAWGENVGWGNFYPSSSDGVIVGTKILSGYVWQENVGWINVGSGNPDSETGYYLNTSGDNWGVNHNSESGVLWGYAWGENVGWINFGTNPHDSNWGVSIATGDLPRRFSGWAWGENLGWINFNRDGSYPVSNSVEQDGPTLVVLVSFTARGFSNHVILDWETASEIDTAGFNLLRGTAKDGTYTKITTTLIPAEGSATSGAAYTYTDTGVTGPQIYYYKLEDVGTSGSRNDHGPVSVAVGDVFVGQVTGTGSISPSVTADGIGAIGITGTGTHTVTTGKYSGNPAGPPSLTPSGDCWFVNLDDTTGVTGLTLAFTPAHSEDTVYYWNGSAWKPCSSQSFSEDTITVTFTDGTNPRLCDLENLIFALGRDSSAIPALNPWGMVIMAIMVFGLGIIAIKRSSVSDLT